MADDEAFEMESCRACRGNGKVISNLGGGSSEVECPWCEGTGKFPGPEHDAQAHWGGQIVESAQTPPEDPEKAAESAENAS